MVAVGGAAGVVEYAVGFEIAGCVVAALVVGVGFACAACAACIPDALKQQAAVVVKAVEVGLCAAAGVGGAVGVGAVQGLGIVTVNCIGRAALD